MKEASQLLAVLSYINPPFDTLKRTTSIQTTFSDHHAANLEITFKKLPRKRTCKFKTQTSKQLTGVNEIITMEIRTY